jgi:hypothetical protein
MGAQRLFPKGVKFCPFTQDPIAPQYFVYHCFISITRYQKYDDDTPRKQQGSDYEAHRTAANRHVDSQYMLLLPTVSGRQGIKKHTSWMSRNHISLFASRSITSVALWLADECDTSREKKKKLTNPRNEKQTSHPQQKDFFKSK